MISGASPEEPMAHAIRFGIYSEALRQADIPYDPALVKDCSWDLDTCSDQTRELMAMESPPDVIFAGSDSLAQVVLGLEVPHAHIHLLPMNTEADVDFHNKKSDIPAEEFKEISQKIYAEFMKL